MFNWRNWYLNTGWKIHTNGAVHEMISRKLRWTALYKWRKEFLSAFYNTLTEYLVTNGDNDSLVLW